MVASSPQDKYRLIASQGGHDLDEDLAPSDALLEEEEDRHLVCRDCGNRITRENWRIAVSGQHVHIFFNPHGLVFEIGCFDKAPGVAALGQSSSEFSWFAGNAWRVAICRSCLSHIGWRFEGESGLFHGLILAHLIPES